MSKLLYSDFSKVVLDFQLREHERFLQKFNQNFKRFDLNQDGIVDEQEFRALVISMGVLNDQSEIEQLLH
jgi:Ca2+-binding EF-hand superfamily protein